MTMDVHALKEKWMKVDEMLTQRFNKKLDFETVLFLIGINEVGFAEDKKFTKEQKQDLMHVATCVLLAQDGIYEYDGHDAEGWPHYLKVKQEPNLILLEQELYLKSLVVRYFEEE
jgi:hypothetical protein